MLVFVVICCCFSFFSLGVVFCFSFFLLFFIYCLLLFVVCSRLLFFVVCCLSFVCSCLFVVVCCLFLIVICCCIKFVVVSRLDLLICCVNLPSCHKRKYAMQENELVDRLPLKWGFSRRFDRLDTQSCIKGMRAVSCPKRS